MPDLHIMRVVKYEGDQKHTQEKRGITRLSESLPVDCKTISSAEAEQSWTTARASVTINACLTGQKYLAEKRGSLYIIMSLIKNKLFEILLLS